MDLPAPLAWLVDLAGASPGPDRFLAELGGRLLAYGLPLAGGALTLAVPHPIIARRTWLWRAETGAVIEALDEVIDWVALDYKLLRQEKVVATLMVLSVEGIKSGKRSPDYWEAERPWIAGLLAQWLPREEALQSRYVVLARPSGAAVRLDVVRADGEVVYVGKGSTSGSAIAFRVSDAVRPGAAPLNVDGRITRSSIEIERAIVFTSRIAVRQAIAIGA